MWLHHQRTIALLSPGIYFFIPYLILRYLVMHMMPGFASRFAQIYNGELVSPATSELSLLH